MEPLGGFFGQIACHGAAFRPAVRASSPYSDVFVFMQP
jgi:hypothetical protein